MPRTRGDDSEEGDVNEDGEFNSDDGSLLLFSNILYSEASRALPWSALGGDDENDPAVKRATTCVESNEVAADPDNDKWPGTKSNSEDAETEAP
jgi:hypothetical protein